MNIGLENYSHEECVEGFLWYLYVSHQSFKKLQTFSPPVNGDEIRLHYGLFFQYKYAALQEGARALKTVEPRFMNRFKADFLDHKYVSELRNFIVHQGAAIDRKGIVVDQVVVPLSPLITTRHGTFKSSSYTLIELAVNYETVVNTAFRTALDVHPEVFDPPFLSRQEITRLATTEGHLPPEALAALPDLDQQLDPMEIQASLTSSRREKLATLIGS